MWVQGGGWVAVEVVNQAISINTESERLFTPFGFGGEIKNLGEGVLLCKLLQPLHTHCPFVVHLLLRIYYYFNT